MNYEMEWEEFVRRGEERREQRAPKPDRITNVLTLLLFMLVVFIGVWGVMR